MTISGMAQAGPGRARTQSLAVGILGPVIVRSGHASMGVPRTGQRILLAMLALAANRPVSTDELIDAVWDEDPSRQRERNLHVQMYQLRRMLAGLEPDRDQPRIVTTNPGYRILLGPGELDSDDFARTVEQGRAAMRCGDPATAADELAAALRMWRGPALADVTSCCPRLARAAARMEEQRLAVVEDRIAADLSAGVQPADALAAELTTLVSANPLRERLRGQLMVALYRAGRRADALETFGAGRHLLSEELGLDPGPELTVLHQRILARDRQLGDPQPLRLAAEPGRQAASGAPGHTGLAGIRDLDGPVVPRQLPARTGSFSGRAAELAALDGTLARLRDGDTGGAPGSGLVVVIDGTAGSGKTALAVHWAYSAAADFPDGQLYADLHGNGLAGRPASSAEVIRGFLAVLGVPDRHIPASADGQAALYRTLLAGRRILVVLDNARDAEQVRPLLPPSPLSLVIVTSRCGLPGLTVTNGAVPVTISAPAVVRAG